MTVSFARAKTQTRMTSGLGFGISMTSFEMYEHVQTIARQVRSDLDFRKRSGSVGQ